MSKASSRDHGKATNLPPGTIDRWLAGSLSFQIIASILLLGTVHPQVLLALSILSIGTGVLAAYTYRRDTGGWPANAVTLVIGALTLWTVLQAVPWPIGLVRRLAPSNVQTWAAAYRDVVASLPSWLPISLDPGASWLEALRGLTYLGAATTATVVANRRGGSWTAATVFISGLLAGFLTLLHGLLGWSKVYGIYEPVNHFSAWHIGPLLNANHLAGYLNLSLFVGMGMLFMAHHVQRRAFVFLGVLFGVAALISTGSRGAVLVFVVGMLLLSIQIRPVVRRRRRKWLRWLPWATAAGGAVMAALGMTTGQWSELTGQDLSKLDMMAWARPMIVSHPWVGVGRGAFESVFPAYRVTPNNVVFTHAENILVQWTSEWGIFIGVLALVALAWLLRPRPLGVSRSGLATGMWLGLVVLVLQNLVDFSLEVPGVALSATVIIATLWADKKRTSMPPKKHRAFPFLPSWWRKDRASWLRYTWALGLPVALTLLVWPLALTRGMPTVSEQRRQLHELISRKPLPDGKTFHRAYQNAVLRHPAEPYFSRIGAYWAWRTQVDKPMPYLERTFRLAKVAGPAHLLTARILFSYHKYAQARLELRHAIADAPALGTPAVALALRRPATFEELHQIVPKSPPGRCVALDLLGSWLAGRNPKLGTRFDIEAIAHCPKASSPLSRIISRRIHDLESSQDIPTEPPCQQAHDRDTCTHRVLLLVDRLQVLTPSQSQAQQYRARLWLVTGDKHRASTALQTACDGVRDRLPCLRTRLDIADKLHHSKLVERTLQELQATGCPNGTMCEVGLLAVGDYLSHHGRGGEAVAVYRRATQRSPTSVGAWTRYANAASAHGMHHAALQAYKHALRLRPNDANLQRAVDREKNAAFSRILRSP